VSKHTVRRRAGWSPIRAPAGAQPYEWYVTFKKIIFMYRGPTIARRAGRSPD
jgi:hypothetical protein